MLQSTSGIRVGLHRVRTTAQRLWLWGSLQRTVGRAVRALSYPETSGFPECRAIQVSPQVPAASVRPHQPCSAEPVPLLPYGPGARLALAFIHVRSESARAVGRFLVAQHLGGSPRGQSGSNGALQLRAPVATWRALLEAPRYGGNWVHVATWTLSVWRTDVPFRAYVFGSLAGCTMESVERTNPMVQARRACVFARGSARDHRLSFMTYSESRSKKHGASRGECSPNRKMRVFKLFGKVSRRSS